MAVLERKKKGKTTVEYVTIQSHYRELTSHLQHNIVDAAAEFYSKSLIPSAVKDKVNNPSLSDYQKSSMVVSAVHSAVEFNSSNYHTFTASLVEIGSDSVVKNMSDTFQSQSVTNSNYDTEQATNNVSSTNQNSSGDSASSVSKSKSCETNCSEDSAYEDGDLSSPSLGGEQYNSEAIDLSKSSEYEDACENSNRFDSPIEFSPPSAEDSSNLFKPIEQSVTNKQSSEEIVSGKSFQGVNPNAMAHYEHFYQYQNEKSIHKEIVSQLEADIECWRTKHDLKERELNDLREKITLREQKVHSLEKEHAFKDETICNLKSKQSELEHELAELHKKFVEAERKKVATESKVLAATQQFAEREEELKIQLAELREMNKKEILARQNIEKELTQLQYAKLKETAELTQKNNELEKIEIQLLSKLREQELMNNEAIAVKDKLIAEKEKELAESRQQVAEQKLAELQRQLEHMKLEPSTK